MKNTADRVLALSVPASDLAAVFRFIINMNLFLEEAKEDADPKLVTQDGVDYYEISIEMAKKCIGHLILGILNGGKDGDLALIIKYLEEFGYSRQFILTYFVYEALEEGGKHAA